MRLDNVLVTRVLVAIQGKGKREGESEGWE